MSNPLLVLGNKRYSSWSLRGYLALKFAGLPFDEKVIPLFKPDTHQAMKAANPFAPARVPSLKLDQQGIWDTLAIMEYAAEISINGPLWPEDQLARAHARSVVAEMHSGFTALRESIPMNLSRLDDFQPLSQSVQDDVDRICTIWEECRQKCSANGPFLFGRLSMADAAYAPVVARFKSRSIPVTDNCKDYMQAIWELPDFVAWRADAAKEEWIIEQ